MPFEITMPQLTDTMTEGTVVKWLKKEGDKVKSGETIAEVETDKAVMEMEISDSGTLAAILIGDGQKAAVGAAMGLIAKAGEDPKDVKKNAGAKSVAGAKPASGEAPAPVAKAAVESSGGGGVATLAAASRGEIHEPDEVGHGATRETPTAVPPIPGNGNGHRVFASPLARRIAADRGIDLARSPGAVPAAGSSSATSSNSPQAVPRSRQPQPPPAPVQAPGATQVIVMTKMRSAIAARCRNPSRRSRISTKPSTSTWKNSPSCASGSMPSSKRKRSAFPSPIS